MTAFLDGRPIDVTRAVLAPGYVGYYLVELQIPAIVNRGASELRIVMNGEESNRVKLYLEPECAAAPVALQADGQASRVTPLSGQKPVTPLHAPKNDHTR